MRARCIGLRTNDNILIDRWAFGEVSLETGEERIFRQGDADSDFVEMSGGQGTFWGSGGPPFVTGWRPDYYRNSWIAA
jgi:hypothetical protein